MRARAIQGPIFFQGTIQNDGAMSSCDFADGLFVKKKDPFRDAFPTAAEDNMVNLANMKKMAEWVKAELQPAVQALARRRA